MRRNDVDKKLGRNEKKKKRKKRWSGMPVHYVTEVIIDEVGKNLTMRLFA